MEGNSTAQRPIFRVGCPSSGTTLLQSILEAHPNISCGQETDFLVSCRPIVEGRYGKSCKIMVLNKSTGTKRLQNCFVVSR
jgi:hypothetical protein